jgi:tetratricopeptide (TPR) repeat protein
MTAEEFLWYEFKELCDGKKITQNALKSLLMRGKLMILLDGLNELPQRELEKVDVSSSQIGFKEKEANKRLFDPRENSLLVLARESKSRFILSCRTFEYTHLPGWREFRILPLNDEQIGDFVQRHLGHKAQHLETILEQRPGLRELMRTPFFLRSLIGLTQGDWQELSTDRFQLVGFTCRAALLRETKRRSLNIQEVAKLLGEKSLDSMVNGWIGSWFTTSLKLNPDTEKNEQPRTLPFVDVFRCAEGAGLVIRARENPEEVAYRYQHQLVQEALALIYLKSEHFENAEYSEVQSLKHIGEVHAEWGKFKEAQENFLRALELCPTVGAESIRASILLNVSRIYRFWRQSKQGLKYAAAAIQLLDHMGDTIQLAETYHELGILNERVKQSKEAEKYFRLALAVYKRLGEESKYAYEIIYGLADLYSAPMVYKIPKAMRWYQKALEIFEAQDDAFGIVRTKLEMAHAWRLWGEMDRAEELFRFCAEEFEKLQKPWFQVKALQFWGYNLRDTRRLLEAIPIFEKALHLAQQHRLQAEQISLLSYGLGWTTSFQGKHRRALELLYEALSLAKRRAAPYFIVTTYGYGLGFVCWRAKDFQKTAEYLLLYDKSMDEEYRLLYLHPIFRIGIIWAKTIGIHANASWLARSISRFLWIPASTLVELLRPSHWLGRQLWRLFWWSHRF